MNDIYKYSKLNEIEVHPEFVILQQMMNDVSKSIWESENEAKEKVSKVILNKLGILTTLNCSLIRTQIRLNLLMLKLIQF